MTHQFLALLDRLRTLESSHATLLVGIDGCGGAGKSALAKILAQGIRGTAVVHMDDFYLPSVLRTDSGLPQFDWRRLAAQVFAPLSGGRAARYQLYDWHSDTLAQWVEVSAGGPVIVEGVGTLRKELRHFYDLKVWVDCPRELRLSRGIARDGEAARNRWQNEWMPSEDRYVMEHNPIEVADFVVDGLAA